MSKIASIQMCSSCKVETNLQTAATLLAKAAKLGAQVAVLAEMFAMIGKSSDYKLSFQEPLGNGPIQDFLSTQAKKWGIWIVGGAIPISTNHARKVHTASLIYDNHGHRVGRYNKIHLIEAQVSPTEYYRETDFVEPGHDIVVIETPIGKIGLSICYDIRFPELHLAAREKGAELLFIPAAFNMTTGPKHW